MFRARRKITLELLNLTVSSSIKLEKIDALKAKLPKLKVEVIAKK